MAITISGTTGIAGVDGSAGTPAVQGTDTNTGVFYPAADTVGVSTGGSERVRVDSSGNVGIGTSSFTHPFTVKKSNAGDWTCKFSNSSATGVSGFGYYDNSDTWKGYVGYDNGDANFLKLYATTSVGIKFITNTTEAMRIDSSGNLLVGTTDTGATSGAGFKLRPNGGGSAGQTRLDIVTTGSTAATASYALYSTGAGAFRFFVQDSGNINATSTSITAISDISLKENIRPLETGLTEVMALQPRRFDWKEETHLTEKNVAGFIAQEVEQVLPELVYDYQYSENEIKKSLKMGDILPTLVKAIQEQQALITALTTRIEALEKK